MRHRDWLDENWLATGEGWLGRVGVGLLVLGLVFLFRYAVQRGWLTPELRITMGLLGGGILLFGGLRLFPDRPRFRQILMGGGVVVHFITGLAASELYGIVSPVVALASQAAVAAVAFRIASQQDDALMATTGAAGALIPPSVLLEGSVPGAIMWSYLLLMIGWIGLLYARRGWSIFLMVAAACAVMSTFHRIPDQLPLQLLGVAVLVSAWGAFAVLPLVHAPPPGRTGREEYLPAVARLALPILVSLGLAFSAEQFVLTRDGMFEIAMEIAAAGFAVVAIALHVRRAAAADAGTAAAHRRDALLANEAFSAATVATVTCLATALIVAFYAPYRYMALAFLATACVAAGPRLRVSLLPPLGHLLFGVVALEFAVLAIELGESPAFDSRALGFIVVTALAAWTATRLEELDRTVYGWAVFIAAHTLLATELVDVPGAPWLATASYAIVGSALILFGLTRGNLTLQRAGMLSLGLLVARLFLYDLANASAGVRIVLFVVIGLVFLVLSYLFRSRLAEGAREAFPPRESGR